MNKRLKILILASLTLNVLLGGAMAGHLLHRPSLERSEKAAQVVADPYMKERVRKLFKDDERARDEIRKMREAAVAKLMAEKFDKVSYGADMKHINMLYDQRRKRASDEIAAIAAQLNTAERRAFAVFLNPPPRKK